MRTPNYRAHGSTMRLGGAGVLPPAVEATPKGAAEQPLLYLPSGYAGRTRLIQALADRDGSPHCFYCGRVANSIDHVTARAHGGSDSIENLVLACWPCNDEKNTTPGWVFVLLKIDDFDWPDPFLRPVGSMRLDYAAGALEALTSRAAEPEAMSPDKEKGSCVV